MVQYKPGEGAGRGACPPAAGAGGDCAAAPVDKTLNKQLSTL